LVTEARSGASEPGAGRLGVVLYTQTFKIDGFLPEGTGLPVLQAAPEPLVLQDCKVYDRLQKDKFVFSVSRMEVPRTVVEVLLPRDAITKEGVFSAS
jgi:uncharacterized protein YfaA (DUF2138 family)